MTETLTTPGERGGLHAEAADWFTLMRGPEAEHWREAFNAWLARAPEHRRAYNAAAQAFSMGKFLKHDTELARSPQPPPRLSPPPARKAAQWLTYAALASGLALSTAWIMRTATPERIPTPATVSPADDTAPGDSSATLQTGESEIREFALADGSRVALDADSRMAVQFTAHERRLELTRGRARFYVKTDGRPFIVQAGNSAVTALGTVFDVDLRTHDQVTVDLWRGRVKVEHLSAAQSAPPQVITMIAGRRLRLVNAPDAPLPAPSRLPSAEERWPDGLREYASIRLDELLRDAGRHSGGIELRADPRVAGIRVSGTFRLTDHRQLAADLARLLSLSLAESPDVIVLSPDCSGQKNCSPPS